MTIKHKEVQAHQTEINIREKENEELRIKNIQLIDQIVK